MAKRLKAADGKPADIEESAVEHNAKARKEIMAERDGPKSAPEPAMA